MSMKMHPSEIFKVLGVETRVKIIELLKSRGPLGAKSISEKLGITPAAVSQHLKVLRQADLVKSERKGYYIPYSVDEVAMEQCCGMLIDVCRCDCGPRTVIVKRILKKDTLQDLEGYKKELENKLKEVEDRISQLRAEEE
jgi:DNA-binding transcriptional ArsR family regulator